MRTLIFSVTLLISSFIFSTCSKDDDVIIPEEESSEHIISSKSATIGNEGGTLIFDDSTTLNVSKGTLTKDYTITISKIANENIFGSSDNRNCYDISGLPAGTKVNLSFPCPRGKETDYIGVFNYNPESFEGEQPNFNYNSSQGRISISNFSLRESPAQYRRWIIEWGDKQPIGEEFKLIPMPFYEQIGGSCWAADATILSKAYTPYATPEPDVEIKDYLNEMDLGADDGIDPWSYMKVLYKKFNALTGGASATTEGYFNKNNLLNAIIKRLKEDKPVVLYMPNYSHSVLMIGYRTKSSSSELDNYELIIHDTKGTIPVNSDDGTMYTTREWSWFLKNAVPTTYSMIMYANTPVHSKRTLQTINLPTLSNQNRLYFEYYKGIMKGTIECFWDHTKPDGISWVKPDLTDVAYLPQTTKTLQMKLQMYNSDLSADKEGTVNIKLTNLKTKDLTFSKGYSVTLGTDKKPTYLDISLDTSEWSKNLGDTTIIDYRLDCSLTSASGGTLLDGWSVNFKIKGSPANSLKYINNMEFNPVPVFMYNSYYKTNVSVSVSGNQFRVKNESNLHSNQNILLGIPEIITSEKKTINLGVKIDSVVINYGPWNPDAIKAIIKKAEYRLDGNTTVPLSIGEKSSRGNWNIPIEYDKNSKSKSMNLYLYLDLIMSDNQEAGLNDAAFPLNVYFDIDK